MLAVFDENVTWDDILLDEDHASEPTVTTPKPKPKPTQIQKYKIAFERNNFALADTAKIRRLSSIENYNFKSDITKVECLIDFIDIRFSTAKHYERSDLKTLITKILGHEHYIKKIQDNIFSIRFHDVKSYKDLFKRLNKILHLTALKDVKDITIDMIELSTDFYLDHFDDETAAALATALFKSIRIPHDSKNVRLYRMSGETFRLDCASTDITPFSNKDFIYHLSHGFNIGIGDQSKSYRHIYVKKTDTIDGIHTQLQQQQQRVRCEWRVDSETMNTLLNTNIVNLSQLKKLITRMSSETKFTKFSGNIHPCAKYAFEHFPRTLGRERAEFNAKRYSKPQLSKSVETFATINQIIAKRHEKLACKFS